MQKILFIAMAGALGTLARYGLSGLVHRLTGAGFPWGTLSVNVIGCFLFALFWTLAMGRLNLDPDLRVAVLVGFMGAFTTFSSYIFEVSGFIQESQWLMALGNFAIQHVLGFSAFFLGLAVGRFF